MTYIKAGKNALCPITIQWLKKIKTYDIYGSLQVARFCTSCVCSSMHPISQVSIFNSIPPRLQSSAPIDSADLLLPATPIGLAGNTVKGSLYNKLARQEKVRFLINRPSSTKGKPLFLSSLTCLKLQHSAVNQFKAQLKEDFLQILESSHIF